MFLSLRILLLFAFALFWGGLTFYTGFVVRISHDVLDNSMEGGLITQRVTGLLQWLGVVTVLPMAINGLAVRRRCPRFGNALLMCSAILACAVLGLIVVHGQLDAVIDVSRVDITDRDAFDNGHRRYNQLTTIEWLATVVYLPITIAAWRTMDLSAASQSLDSDEAD